MPSTVIRSFEYDPRLRALTVQFVTGRRYRYAGVPPEVHAAMRRVMAKGSFFNARIRGRYLHEELQPDGWGAGDTWPDDDPAFGTAA